jgi:hypothetical protein
MSTEPFEPPSPDATGNEWLSSAAVREFSAIHRLIREFSRRWAPVVDPAQASDRAVQNQTLAKALPRIYVRRRFLTDPSELEEPATT